MLNLNRMSKILREAKESQFLSFYNTDAMEEIVSQYNKITETLNKEKLHFIEESEKPVKEQFRTSYIICLTTALQRLFRLVLSYLNYRIVKIKKEYWRTSMNLPKDNKELMSPSERTWLKGYDQLVKGIIIII